MSEIKIPTKPGLKDFHDKKRAAQSDWLVLYYFKIIRNQVKNFGRSDDVLLEYINELEYRQIKYRL